MGFENGKLVRVVLRAVHDADGDTQVNVLHYDLDDNSDVQPNDPQSLADTFRDDVVPHWSGLYRSTWTIQPVEVVEEKDPQHPLNARQSWSSGSPAAGTNGGSADLLPRGICAVATVLTAKIGRRFRGRIFIGGSHAEDQQNDGAWGSTHLGEMNTFLGSIPLQPDIAGPGSGAQANWCVYSRTNRGANVDPYAQHVTGYILRPLARYHRSRQI